MSAFDPQRTLKLAGAGAFKNILRCDRERTPSFVSLIIKNFFLGDFGVKLKP